MTLEEIENNKVSKKFMPQNGDRYLIFDESGNLGSNGRYFVIACIDTKRGKELHNIMKNKLKAAKGKFPELNLHSNEVKAKDAYPCVKYHIMESIISKDVKLSYIVADLKFCEPALLKDKNIFYNYLMKLLIDSIITNADKNTKIKLISDNKTTKVTSINCFKDYIILWFNYEKRYNIDMDVIYLDSDAKNAYIVQAADYLANAVYSNYEYGKCEYLMLAQRKLEIESKFPRNKFGK